MFLLNEVTIKCKNKGNFNLKYNWEREWVSEREREKEGERERKENAIDQEFDSDVQIELHRGNTKDVIWKNRSLFVYVIIIKI